VLTAEAAVLLVSAVAVALLAERRGHPALAGAAAPLVLLGTGLLAPAPLSAFETVPALRPVLLAVTAAALAAIALSVADPGGRRLYHRR
jgi:hypothetical protein